jgi:hypothetical protein
MLDISEDEGMKKLERVIQHEKFKLALKPNKEGKKIINGS